MVTKRITLRFNVRVPRATIKNHALSAYVGGRKGFWLVAFGFLAAVLGCDANASQDSLADSTMAPDIVMSRDLGLDELEPEVSRVSEVRSGLGAVLYSISWTQMVSSGDHFTD